MGLLLDMDTSERCGISSDGIKFTLAQVMKVQGG